jgi:hypothetical protein
MLDELAAVAVSIHIHSADPGAGDANAEGSPETIAWDAAAAGAVVPTANVSFTGLTASVDVLFFTLWDVTDTTRYAKGSIDTGDQAANAAGEYEITTATTLQITDS